MEFLSSLHFLNLAGFTLAAALPLLVLAYRKQDHAKRLVVSSLLLLKTLPRRRIARSKLHLPLRFFLELIALLALSIAFAHPTWKQAGKRFAVLFDNSLSMNAPIGNQQGQFRRIEAAHESLSRWLDRQDTDAAISIFTATPTLQLQGTERVSPTEARRIADAIGPTELPDSLASALGELRSSSNYDAVVLVTDRTLSSTSPSDGLAEIIPLHVGEPVPNIFLSGIRAGQDTDDAMHLIALVGTSSLQSANFVLEVYKQDSAESAATLLTTKTDVALSDKLIEVDIALPKQSRPQLIRLQLQTTGNSQNALSDDDVGYFVLGGRSQTRVLVVSPESSSNTLGLDSLRWLSAELASPEKYASLSLDDLSRYSLVIFHKTAPRIAPHVPALFILPPAGNSIFPIAADVETPLVTSWQTEHPITAYLKLPLLRPPAASTFQTPAWAENIIQAERGPLVVAGESEGVRFAAFGFEVLPFEGGHTPLPSILTLNTLYWLLGAQEFSSGFITGTNYRVPPLSTAIIRTPAGDIVKEENPHESPQPYPLEKAGFYQLTTLSQRGHDVQRRADTIAVNAFHIDESSTAEEKFISPPTSVSDEHPREEVTSPLWPPFLWAALVFLVLELVLRLFPALLPQRSPAEEQVHA